MSAIIGVLPEERKASQTLLIDVDLSVDVNTAALEDNLSKTINYAAVCRCITEYVSGTSYQLIETLADRMAGHLQHHFSLPAIRLCITKKPFDLPHAEGVGVVVYRESS